MLKNLRIVFYFRTIVIGLCLSILLLSGLSWWATSTASASLHAVHGERMAKVDRLSQIAENITKNRLEIMLMFQHDPQGALHGVHDHAISVHFERYAKRREETSRLWQEVQDTPMDDAEHALFAQAAEARKAWVPKADAALESVRHDQYSSEVMAAYLKAGREEGDAMMKAIDALTKYQASAAAEAAAAADRRHRTAGIMFGLVLFGLGVPVMVVSLRLLHRLRRGFEKANSSAQLIAQGDLTVHIESDSRNEIGELLLSMEQMRRNLTQVIGQVRGAADSIELAAAEVAAGNADRANEPSRRPATCSRPPVRRRSWARWFVKTPPAHTRPINWRKARRRWPARGARLWPKWWTPCMASTTARDGLPTSSG